MSRTHITPKKLGLIGVPLLLIVAVVAALELTDTTHFFHSPEVKVVSSASKGDPLLRAEENNKSSSGTDKGGSSSTATKASGASSSPTPSSNVKLKGPSGTFVSNHHPNLSGKPAPNQIQSVCNSTPAATCKIQFAKGDVIKSLPAETADSDGAVYWTWKLQDIGLTEGSWSVTAIAKYGDQTKSTKDTINLEVAR